MWGAVPPAAWGDLSRAYFLKAIEYAYAGTVEKLPNPTIVPIFKTIETFDHVVVHAPYNTLLWKVFQRFYYTDARRAVAAGKPLPAKLAALAPFAALPLEATYDNANADTQKLNAALDVSAAAAPRGDCHAP